MIALKYVQYYSITWQMYYAANMKNTQTQIKEKEKLSAPLTKLVLLDQVGTRKDSGMQVTVTNASRLLQKG
ncbi:MAG: hypothetical protein QXN55_05650 [Candidatus Nitrosotenuis sp.]